MVQRGSMNDLWIIFRQVLYALIQANVFVPEIYLEHLLLGRLRGFNSPIKICNLSVF